jgi:8-oxo-dGTP pyrophosphatase MutT (NUDIX family)
MQDPRLHFVTATAIIVKKNSEGEREYLIVKRSPKEKAFPGRWTVPGGKLVLSEYKNLPKTNQDAWYNIIDWLLKKEVKEEVGLLIGAPNYLTDLAFVRPDGYPVVTLSYWCWYKSGKVRLCEDLIDSAWVKAGEAKRYDFMSDIDKEIVAVERLLRNSSG